MRTYAGRFLNQNAQRTIRAGRELRDAIVIEVFSSLHYCTVKIHGSNQIIKAYYNENWEAYPKWLKPGNCVRINTPGGTGLSRVEIVGHGLTIPIAIAGGDVNPIAPDPPDAVMSGMGLLADGDGMSVIVETGVYRVADVEYVLGPVEMDETAIEMDRSIVVMDTTAGIVEFDNLTAGKFRYDLIVIGADGTLDVVKGSETTGEPTMPDTPAAHALIGWVFFQPRMEDATSDYYRIIVQADIGGQWTELNPTVMLVSGDFDLAWSDETTTINIDVVDQFGVTIVGTYFLTIVDAHGNGTLSAGVSSPYTFYGSTSIGYTRYGEPPGEDTDAISSILTLTESTTGFVNGAFIINRDAAGDIMI